MMTDAPTATVTAPLGLLADSHGRAEVTAAAVAALLDAGARTLIHLGDIGTEAVLEEMLGADARIVFGNCDADEIRLRRHAERLGIHVDHPIGDVTAGGRRIMFTHGHLGDAMARALTAAPDYLLHGHTHVRRDDRVNGTRVINPGALFRAAEYTAAVLDPAQDALQVIVVPKPS